MTETIHKRHRLISAHKCICGWEGDSAITHVIDALGIERAGWLSSYGELHTETHDYRDCTCSPVYTIKGLRAGQEGSTDE